jgi:hypothetical protein
MSMKKNTVNWSAAEKAILSRLTTPKKIQEYLDTLEYSGESRYRSPRSVLRDTKGHCFDGAVFAAAALRMLGYPPLIVDMQAVRDDDHVIAVFRKNGCWGALAKSNFTGLRFREPVYKTIRELVMSYFESFYNLNREKTLRKFSRPVNLAAYDRHNWMTDDGAMELIGTKLCYIKTQNVMTPAMIRALQPVDDRMFEAGIHGANMAGMYDPNEDAGS